MNARSNLPKPVQPAFPIHRNRSLLALRSSLYGSTPRPRRAWSALCVAILVITYPRGARGAEEARPTPVILISVDTLRADHLSSYGYRRFATPQIDSLGRGGTIFTAIDAQIPLTLPSHTSLLTSTYPFVNGVGENGRQVPQGLVTLASVLKSHGYQTAAFIGGYFLARQYGLDRGFDVYDSPFGPQTSVVRALDLKRPAEQVTNAAAQWLADHCAEPTFVFIHLYDLHKPYDPPKQYLRKYGHDEYDAELGYTDDVLGRFFELLSQRGLFGRSLIVVTADHGESLGEHGESTHGYFVYQSTLHVPLIVHWPEGMGPYPGRCGSPAGLIDVAPTILEALRLPEPASFQGRSLLDLLDPQAPASPREVYSESLYAHDNFRCAALRSVRAGNYQYISAPRPELYDLARDPGELRNLVTGDRVLAASLHDQLAALLSEYAPQGPAAQPTPVSPRDKGPLRALGYLALAGPEPAPAENGADPKDRLGEYRLYLRATRLARIGRLPEAAATFRRIIAEDPADFPARVDLADCYMEEKQYDAAIRVLQVAYDLAPHSVSVEERIATLWLSTGHYRRAREEYHSLLSINPHDDLAEYNLGVIAVIEGRLRDGERHLRAALQLQPQSAEAHNALGEAFLRGGRMSAAETEFEEAIRLDAGYPIAYYNLGRVFEKQGRMREAAQEFRAALRVDPQLASARRALKQIASAPQ